MFTVTTADLELAVATLVYPFLRVLALMSSAPVLSHRSVPRTARIGFAFLVALLIAPTLPPGGAVSPFSAAGVLLVIQQVVVGVAIGLVMQAVFAAADVAARYVPAVGRAFVGAARAEAEARQCADALFLARELFATPRREAILILVAAFERRVVVVPDAGFRGRVTAAEWRGVVDRMTPSLRRGAVREAFAQGLAALEALLRAKGCGPGDGANRLPDDLVRGSAR